MIHIYKDKAGRWRWHLKAGNEKITSDSGQGYESEAAARRAIETCRALFASAGVEVDPPEPRILIRRKPQPSLELLRTVRPKQPLPEPLRSALKVQRRAPD